MADDVKRLLGISEDELRRQASAEIEKALDASADAVHDFWKSVSPVDTGEYRSSFEIEKFTDDNGNPGRIVRNTSDYAHIIEYGSKHMDEHAPRAKTEIRFARGEL